LESRKALSRIIESADPGLRLAGVGAYLESAATILKTAAA
jgi:hypothetical protein